MSVSCIRGWTIMLWDIGGGRNSTFFFFAEATGKSYLLLKWGNVWGENACKCSIKISIQYDVSYQNNWPIYSA